MNRALALIGLLFGAHVVHAGVSTNADRVVEASLFDAPAPAAPLEASPMPLVYDAPGSDDDPDAAETPAGNDSPPPTASTLGPSGGLTTAPISAGTFDLSPKTASNASTQDMPALIGEPVLLATVDAEKPAYAFTVRNGEYARDALERWCKDHDFTLVWQSRFDIPIVADATFPADSLRDAVTRLLRAIWHPKAPLVADEYANNILVIHQP